MTDQPMIRIVVVDDHPMMREGLRALAASLPDVEIVGEAGHGAAAGREVQLTRPDVVVMDLHMPGTDGVEATREIVRLVPTTKVLVLTMFEDDDSVFAAMRAGASGYLIKGAEQVISGKTVSNHISSIFAKLQVADRAEAIIRARHEGLGQAGR